MTLSPVATLVVAALSVVLTAGCDTPPPTAPSDLQPVPPASTTPASTAGALTSDGPHS